MDSPCVKHGGLMVSALIPGSSDPVSSLGRGHGVVFLGRNFASHTVPLSTQV